MEQHFWREKWQAQQIGFHRDVANDGLVSHALDVFVSGGTILVPLCGMTLDMDWLLQHGFAVIGVEFVPEAIEGLKERWGAPDEIVQRGEHVEHRWGEQCTIVLGDFFTFTAKDMGRIDGIWDRAAIVALDPQTRIHYQRVLEDSLHPEGVILMRTFAYDQSKMEGPPFAVNTEAVSQLFPPSQWTVTCLETRRSVPDERLQERGLDWQSIDTYAIRR